MRDYRLGRLNGGFVVSWWEEGRRRRYRLGTSDPSEADRLMRDFVAGLERRSRPTVATLWAAYCHDRAGRPIVVTLGHHLKAIGPTFGHLYPDQITVDLCRSYAAGRRAAGRKPGTIWTELGNLRMVLHWAEKQGLIERAPAIERPSKPAPRDRHLTRAEAVRLADGARSPHIRLAIILLLGTAARVGAILDLTWDRVDFERGLVTLARDDGRSRKGRATVPMSGMVRAALAEARAGALTDHVVEYAGEGVRSIKKGFAAAVSAAGLSDVSPHVLRHTAAVWMAEAGKPMTEIAQYLGHRDSRITERVYARFSPQHLRGSADVLEFLPAVKGV